MIKTYPVYKFIIQPRINIKIEQMIMDMFRKQQIEASPFDYLRMIGDYFRNIKIPEHRRRHIGPIQFFAQENDRFVTDMSFENFLDAIFQDQIAACWLIRGVSGRWKNQFGVRRS
uniref:Uncharacterized protein n=1 Tax=Cacopsylla melanoneura TaxID=428564 RepID=A0A8D9BKW1_9HEMI